MKKKFKRIWLQDPIEDDLITWSQTKIFDNDVEYIPADTHREEIAALNAHIEELEEQLRWIPISERLPEPMKLVFVRDIRKNVNVDFLVESKPVEK